MNTRTCTYDIHSTIHPQRTWCIRQRSISLLPTRWKGDYKMYEWCHNCTGVRNAICYFTSSFTPLTLSCKDMALALKPQHAMCASLSALVLQNGSRLIPEPSCGWDACRLTFWRWIMCIRGLSCTTQTTTWTGVKGSPSKPTIDPIIIIQIYIHISFSLVCCILLQNIDIAVT